MPSSATWSLLDLIVRTALVVIGLAAVTILAAETRRALQSFHRAGMQRLRTAEAREAAPRRHADSQATA